jgi:hypothetical protein
VVIWYISPRFGILYQEKSVNRAAAISRKRQLSLDMIGASIFECHVAPDILFFTKFVKQNQ